MMNDDEWWLMMISDGYFMMMNCGWWWLVMVKKHFTHDDLPYGEFHNCVANGVLQYDHKQLIMILNDGQLWRLMMLYHR